MSKLTKAINKIARMHDVPEDSYAALYEHRRDFERAMEGIPPERGLTIEDIIAELRKDRENLEILLEEATNEKARSAIEEKIRSVDEEIDSQYSQLVKS